MEHIDVAIVGQDITALVTALFLARKMRKVVVFPNDNSSSARDVKDFYDHQKSKFSFKDRYRETVPGLEQSGLLFHYLKSCGMENELRWIEAEKDVMVRLDGSIAHRSHTYEEYIIYLIRYFPKQKDRIRRFFNDMSRLYTNYCEQQNRLITNEGHTISSLMIEWGDYSLRGLLEKYFTDSELIDDIINHSGVAGLDGERCSSYDFFMRFISGLFSNNYYIMHSLSDIKQRLITKIQTINRQFIQSSKIVSVTMDDDQSIKTVVDESGVEYETKYVLFSESINPLFDRYFSNQTEKLNDLKRYFPDITQPMCKRNVYIGVSEKPTQIGLDAMNYVFDHANVDGVTLTKLINEKRFDSTVSSRDTGAYILEIVYPQGTKIQKDKIVERLYDYFPRLRKAECVIEWGRETSYQAMLSEEAVRKNLPIENQIDLESMERYQITSNAYLIGDWMRPEAGLFGCFQAGIIHGDRIEEYLYYGEDDDEFFYLSNDEIMMMIRQNYGHKLLGKMEKHINFHIGKSDYFIRTKYKNISLHRGAYPQPDISLFSTNDQLASLVLHKASFESVLKSGGLKYQGKETELYDVVEALKLDDLRNDEVIYQPKTKIYFLGVKFLFVYLSIWALVSLLSNFLNLLWLMPIALLLTAGVTYAKYMTYREINGFEFVINGLLLVFSITALFWPKFNQLRSDDLFLGIMAFIFFVSWLINRPIVHDFHHYDFKQDYGQSRLFKVINNGLTLVWSLIFVSILVFTYVTTERYVTALYNLFFLGIFLTYFYPVMYVKTNIKS